MTPGNGAMAILHLKQRIPYVCVALNESHREHLQKRLEDATFHLMSIKGSSLHQPCMTTVIDSAQTSSVQAKATVKIKTTTGKAGTEGAKADPLPDYLKRIQTAMAKFKPAGPGPPPKKAKTKALSSAAAGDEEAEPEEEDSQEES